MSTPNRPHTQPKPAARPATQSRPAAHAVKANRLPDHEVMLFDRTNYMWMIGGVVLLLIGFMLMSGGKSADPHQFLYSEIYSFRRITLAPIVLLAGFGVEFYAIMRRPRTGNEVAGTRA